MSGTPGQALVPRVLTAAAFSIDVSSESDGATTLGLTALASVLAPENQALE